MAIFDTAQIKGFTLIELLVVVAVTSIISLAIVIAYPHVRAEQKLALAEQTLQAALRGAQQAAINEKRSAECLKRVAPELAKLCSDTGVVLNPAASSMILFADIDQPAANEYSESGDFRVAEVVFPEGVTVEPSEPPTVLIFEGAPPVIRLFSGTSEVKSSIAITLRAGKATRRLHIGSYGQVER